MSMLDFPFVQDCAGILEANQLLLERAMYKDPLHPGGYCCIRPNLVRLA